MSLTKKNVRKFVKKLRLTYHQIFYSNDNKCPTLGSAPAFKRLQQFLLWAMIRVASSLPLHPTTALAKVKSSDFILFLLTYFLMINETSLLLHSALFL